MRASIRRPLRATVMLGLASGLLLGALPAVAHADGGDDGDDYAGYVQTLRETPDVYLAQDMAQVSVEDLVPEDDYQTAPAPAKPYSSVKVNGITYTAVPMPNWNDAAKGALGGCIGGSSGGFGGCATGGFLGGAAGYVVGGLFAPQTVLIMNPSDAVRLNGGLKVCYGRSNLVYYAPHC